MGGSQDLVRQEMAKKTEEPGRDTRDAGNQECVGRRTEGNRGRIREEREMNGKESHSAPKQVQERSVSG